MRNGFESVHSRNPGLDFRGKTFLNFDNPGTPCANEVVVVPVITLLHQFKPGGAVTKIKPLHHPQFLQHLHRTINGGQIATIGGHLVENLTVGQGMRMRP